MEMKFRGQGLNGDMVQVPVHEVCDLVQQDQIHLSAQLFGKREVVGGSKQEDQAGQQTAADDGGSSIVPFQFLQKREHGFFNVGTDCLFFWMERKKLLQRFLLKQGHVQEGGNSLRRAGMAAADFGKHGAGDSEEDDSGISSVEDFLVHAVFVNQTEFTGMKGVFGSENFLAVLAGYNVKKLQIFVGMELGAGSWLKSALVNEGMRCGQNG